MLQRNEAVSSRSKLNVIKNRVKESSNWNGATRHSTTINHVLQRPQFNNPSYNRINYMILFIITPENGYVPGSGAHSHIGHPLSSANPYSQKRGHWNFGQFAPVNIKIHN